VSALSGLGLQINNSGLRKSSRNSIDVNVEGFPAGGSRMMQPVDGSQLRFFVLDLVD
jgi:hypothetical protein